MFLRAIILRNVYIVRMAVWQAEDSNCNPFSRNHCNRFQAQREDIWKQKCFYRLLNHAPYRTVRANRKGTAALWWLEPGWWGWVPEPKLQLPV